MKIKLEKFNSFKLSQNELYPISGGSGSTSSKGSTTMSSGSDADPRGNDQDADFY